LKEKFIILLFFFAWSNLFGQVNYVHYTVQDGLPQMQCMTLFQDADSYLWIGTKGGVSRFDGLHFKNFSLNEGLQDNRIVDISQNTQGQIWVLTQSGLAVLENDKFQAFIPPKNIVFNYNKFVFDNHGNIWLIGGARGDRIIRFKDGKYKEIFKGDFDKREHITGLSYDGEKDIVYFTFIDKKGSKLYTFKKGKFTYTNFKDTLCEYDAQQKLFIKRKFHTPDFTIYKIKKNDTLKLYHSDSYINIPKLYKDSILVFTKSFFTSKMPIQIVKNGKLQKSPLVLDQINDFLYDVEGNLWVASEKGLYRATPFYNYFSQDGMPDYVWSIREDKFGRIWFASYNNAFLHYMEDDTIKKYPQKFKEGGFFYGTISTRNKHVLFSYLDGIIDFDGHKFSRIQLPNYRPTLSMLEDTIENKLYIGNFAGLVIRDSLNNYNLNKRFTKSEAGVIKAMIKNQKGEIWYVSKKTLGSLNRKDTLVIKNDTINGALCLYNDYKDNLWIGTENGLYVYDYKHFIPVKHTALNTMIGSIASIDKTNIVYGGLRGIGILNLEKFYQNYPDLASIDTLINIDKWVDYYSKSEGFFGEEVAQNGIFKDSQNRIWIPTNNNVVMFNPKEVQKKKHQPKTFIKSLQTSDDNVHWVKQIDTLPVFKQRNVHFGFQSIAFSAPNAILYKYRLKGFNDTWSHPTYETSVTYTNLPPGKYTFELLSSNNYRWKEKPIQKHFEIQPFFWQKLWFRFGLILTFLLLLAYLFSLYHKRKINKIKRAERLQKLQLQAVQSQLYPHLLFNAVTAMGSVIFKEEKEKAYDFVVRLSQFMRNALSDSQKTYKTLQEEINFAETYLQLQKMRFVDRFDYEIKIDDEVDLSFEVPQMTVQTYVENAVKYGLEPLKSGGKLLIYLKKIKNGIQIIIQDNGMGIEKAQNWSQKGAGTGIKMMNEIYNLYNENHSCKIHFKLVNLYEIGQKGTQSIVTITCNED